MIDKISEDIEQNNQLSEEIKKELYGIYQDYKVMKNFNVNREELKQRVDKILEGMFKTAFSFYIPMDFINSALGHMLFEIKLDIENSKMYGFTELMIIADKSKQMIFNDYHKGKLTGIETGKMKRVLVTEDALFKYITTIGRNTFSPDEARRRIQLFNKMNRDGLSDEEIRTVLNGGKNEGNNR